MSTPQKNWRMYAGKGLAIASLLALGHTSVHAQSFTQLSGFRGANIEFYTSPDDEKPAHVMKAAQAKTHCENNPEKASYITESVKHDGKPQMVRVACGSEFLWVKHFQVVQLDPTQKKIECKVILAENESNKQIKRPEDNVGGGRGLAEICK